MAEVPPLEDVPDVLMKLQTKADQVVKEHSKQVQAEQIEKTKIVTQLEKSHQVSNFGGFKKGFLFGGKPKKNTPKDKTNSSEPCKISTPIVEKEKGSDPKQDTDDIPFIQAQASGSNLVLKEVQEAMADANVAHEFQDKLAQKLEAHDDVKDVLSDPAWIPILDEFQKDPEASMAKYKNNSKVKKTMLRLCDVLGDTFLHMEKSNKSEEEKLSGELMENPKVKEALTDPLVMKICDFMKEGANDKVQRCIQTANPTERRHIQTLIDVGLFSFSM